MKLEDFRSCFQGVYPSSFYTCSKDGIPNVNYLSQVYLIDEKHVAISGQFLNKTRKNLQENPLASVMLIRPNDLLHVELELHWKRSETSGEIFDRVAERINAIDSQIGGEGRWKLVSIEVFEVTKINVAEEYLPLLRETKPVTTFSLQRLQGAMTELQKSKGLEDLYDSVLRILDQSFGFKHSMLLVPDDHTNRLITISTHGYNQAGVGSEVRIGEGIIGKVAESKRPLAFMGFKREMIYARTSITSADDDHFSRAIELPTLPNTLSQIAVPLLSRNELIGILQIESVENFDLKESDEEFLMTFGSYVALLIENFQMQESPEQPLTSKVTETRLSESKIHVAYYKNDDCIFIDGEYLIRNIPAKLLWKILKSYEAKGQTEFSNRELRMDPTLQLPDFKDNLETRLILLRKRLEKKCPAFKLPSCGRGKFRLELSSKFILEEI